MYVYLVWIIITTAQYKGRKVHHFNWMFDYTGCWPWIRSEWIQSFTETNCRRKCWCRIRFSIHGRKSPQNFILLAFTRKQISHRTVQHIYKSESHRYGNMLQNVSFWDYQEHFAKRKSFWFWTGSNCENVPCERSAYLRSWHFVLRPNLSRRKENRMEGWF